jgi:Putative Flp pilus-assembly TadE/G-like
VVGTVQAPAGGGVHRGRDTGRSLRHRSRDESGSVLVLFSIFLTLFLVCCAIVTDVGYWWANAKKAQIAADACALAAAQSIPAVNPSSGQADPSTGECVIDTGGRDYVLENLPEQGDSSQEPLHLGTVVEWPYVNASGSPDPSQVEATVTMRVGTFFGRIVGLHAVDVTRRAVAEKQTGTGNWAIYAHDPAGCDAGNGLEFDGGAGINIDGRVHSNSRYHVNSGNPSSGDQFWALEGTINRTTCVATLNPAPQGAAYGTGPEPRDHLPQDGVFENWPAWYTPAQFGWPTCSGANFSARNINIKAGKVELKGRLIGGGDADINYSGNVPTGTYCALEKITTSDTLKGTVTLLSPQIQISGALLEFTPHQHNVLLFSVPNWNSSNWNADTNTGNDGTFPTGQPITCTNRNIEMQINADKIKWAGTLFHPCGRIAVNSGSATGGNKALVGTILGYQVKVNQNDFSMIGLSEFDGLIDLALTE